MHPQPLHISPHISWVWCRTCQDMQISISQHPGSADLRCSWCVLHLTHTVHKHIHTSGQLGFQFSWAVFLWHVEKPETSQRRVVIIKLSDSKLSGAEQQTDDLRPRLSHSWAKHCICIFSHKHLTHYVWMRSESQHSSSWNFNFNGMRKGNEELHVPPLSFFHSIWLRSLSLTH